jgi:AraC-like DNA-binding protein
MRVDALAADVFLAIGGNTTQPLFRADLLSWYAARVDRARSLMDAHFHQPLSLTRLSRDVGMSPFHFARVFRELAGVPPHRYLTAVRLTHAARQLREGASVTDTCLAVGFGSLSHFVTAFRRRYGASPSNWMKANNAKSQTRVDSASLAPSALPRSAARTRRRSGAIAR